MAVRTPQPWNIERWEGGKPVELLASCWQMNVAYSAFEQSLIERRSSRIMMRHGARVIVDSDRPEDWPPAIRVARIVERSNGR